MKASNTNKDDHVWFRRSLLSGDGIHPPPSALRTKTARPRALTARQRASAHQFRRRLHLHSHRHRLEAASLREGFERQDGRLFGNALALSNDGSLLAVGSTGESSSATGVNGKQDDTSMPGAGAVYVFVRNGAAWSQQAYVKSSNTGGPVVGYQFGYALSLSSDGSTLAVSQTSDPSNATGINGNQKNTAAPDSGAIFVFTHNGNSWSQQAYVKPWNTTTAGVLFGYSVGLSGNGDTMAVGTYDEEGGRGAIYVFNRNKGTWSQQTRLQGSNAERGDSLGCAISISDDGNTIVGGAFDEDAILTGIQPPNAGSNSTSPTTTDRRRLRIRSCGRQYGSSRPI